MRFNFEFDDRSVLHALNRLVLAGEDMTPGMIRIGEYLLRSTRERFVSKTAPDGSPWAPLSDVTVKRKTRGADSILLESGELFQGLNFNAGPDFAEAGSPLAYADTMQHRAAQGEFGANSRGGPIPWGNIPARPFVGLSNDDREEVEFIIADYIREAFG